MTSKINSLYSLDVNIKANSVDPINILPNEILEMIFSILSPQDLIACSQVNHQWKETVENVENVYEYKIKLQKNYQEDFTPLVEQGCVTWREVYRLYKSLSRFFESCLQERYCNQSFIIKENPLLISLLPNPNDVLLDWILQPFVKHGEHYFSVHNMQNIKVQNKTNSELIISTDNKAMFIYLVAEGDYLFALDQMGFITQLNYKTTEQLQKIETAFAKKDESLTKIFQGQACFCKLNSFAVKDGMLVLKYGTDTVSTNIVEIIDYSNPTHSQLIQNDSLLNLDHVVIEKGKIFLIGKDGVWSYNPLSHQEEFMSQQIGSIQDTVVNINSIYAINQKSEFYSIGFKQKKFSSFSLKTICDDTISKIQVIKHLLFGFIVEKNQVVVIDIPRKLRLLTITLKLDSQASESNDFKNIFNLAKHYLLKHQAVPDQRMMGSFCIVS